jgi:formylglycine-generating enzyme required for sulfatase activity
VLVAPPGAGSVETKAQTFGHDRGQAGLVPVVSAHPAFQGLDLDRGVVWMSNAVYPAFARFRPGAGAGQAMVLARTPGGPENPLLEYPLGKGRIVALAWRLSPHYHAAPAQFRGNFEHLVANLMAYLAGGAPWARAEPDEPGAGVPAEEWRALALAVDDLAATFGDRYPAGADYRHRLAALKASHDEAAGAAGGSGRVLERIASEFRRLRREALLANPLLDFDRLLLVKRRADKMGLPANYQSNSSLDPAGYDNEVAVLSPVRPDGRLTTVFRPEGGRFVGDVDLHFDADRFLFSMPNEAGRWRVFETRADGSGLRCLPLINEPDVDNYDACYLPDGRVVFCSTAPFTGVPCVRGSSHVANLYLLETDGRIRRLTTEQDHDWCPTVLPDGRVVYLRWEYSGLPHAWSRLLFQMYPDGTGQMAWYGSNSYWPAAMFYARPIPGHPTKVAAIVGGHHDRPRMGDLVIFDRAKARFEADGAVRRIGHRGRPVLPALLDLPIAQTWPKFLHPWPLSETYFLVSCKPAADAPWGVYLADAFDNLVLLCEAPGWAMLEPIPLRPQPRPPVPPDRVDPARDDAEVYLTDVYAGPGLKGVPRGTIRSLRLVGYHFAYQGIGGEPDAPGLDGPWDVKRILGTVPVHEDGSAYFRVPAHTPVSVQPLDAEGKAVQLMRSWFTAMPGEVLSCVGCHEDKNEAPPARDTLAARLPPSRIRPWYGPARGFDFRQEVQPVLDRYCIGCHNGRPRPDGRAIPDLTDREPVPTMDNKHPYNLAARFTPSYYVLRRHVRTPTRESDLHLLPPWEFHADTTRLVQMLRKGHHGVRLDAEAWDRLVTWIDLNAPAHGTWTAICGPERVRHQWQRRRAMQKRYAGRTEDPEALPPPPPAVDPVTPEAPAAPAVAPVPPCDGWPFDAAEARRRQDAAEGPAMLVLSLGDGVTMDLVRIPAGEFVMGQADGRPDEAPPCRVAVRAPFWIGRCEVTNAQFAAFDPDHDSGLEYGDYIHFSPGERGWTLSRPRQPVVRVSWNDAMAFCRWLSARTGRRITLPTEAQWEYACRAGTAAPLWYGSTDVDFSEAANVSDATHQAIDPFGWSGRTQVIPPWRPADTRFNDGSRVSASVGAYAPNPWGLHDVHGNVAEWTRSAYRPYPYRNDDGRNHPKADGKRVVRGGSWYDRPRRCRSAFRQAYRPAQGVYDVGFRIVCDAGP